MTRRERKVSAVRGRILQIALQQPSPDPLYRQIYHQVRRAVLDGLLEPGAAIPSTRGLASDLGISRATVTQAYQQLAAEGFIGGTMGAPMRVADNVRRGAAPVPARPIRSLATLSQRGQRLERLVLEGFRGLGEAPRAFRTGVPALDVFPTEVWARLIARRWRRSTVRHLGYGDPFGYLPLQEAIADYVRSARGVRCDPRQILICSGAQQAIDLALRVLLDPGDQVWLEDPGYPGARMAVLGSGGECIPVPVDDDGLNVEEAIARAPRARLAFVTPARQVPLGMALSLPRRLAILQWAAANRSWIFEDDYDGEFRYASSPLSALQGLDEAGNVIFSGTFSKLMFPALRIGYLVVPDSLHDAFWNARLLAGFMSPYLEQAALADFIAEGHFERHIRRMRTLYEARQQTLTALLRRHLAAHVDVAPTDAGMNVTAWLKHNLDDRRVAAIAARRGIDVTPLANFSSEMPIRSGLLLGFAGVREADMESGVRTLLEALEEARGGF